jgi:hypothetical protein
MALNPFGTAPIRLPLVSAFAGEVIQEDAANYTTHSQTDVEAMKPEWDGRNRAGVRNYDEKG